MCQFLQIYRVIFLVSVNFLEIGRVDGSSSLVQIRVTSVDVEEVNAFKMEMSIRVEVEQFWEVKQVSLNETVDDLPGNFLQVRNGREVTLVRMESQVDTARGQYTTKTQIAARIGCLMDFSMYPFDHQRCEMEMGTKNASAVLYSWKDLSSMHVRNARIFASPFSVVRTVASFPDGSYQIGVVPVNARKLSIVVHTRRNYGAYFSSYFVPASSFVFISLLTLWLVYPKISVMINFLNIMLINIFFVVNRGHLDIPKVYYATAMSVYSTTAIIFITLVLFVNVYVLYYIKSEEEDDEERARRRRAYELNIRNDMKFVPPVSTTNTSRGIEDAEGVTTRQNFSTWVLVKRKIMDRIRRNSHWALLITFLLFNFVYWVSMLCVHYF